MRAAVLAFVGAQSAISGYAPFWLMGAVFTAYNRYSGPGAARLSFFLIRSYVFATLVERNVILATAPNVGPLRGCLSITRLVDFFRGI